MAEKGIEISIGNPEAFRKTISTYLSELGIRVEDEFQEAADEIGKEAAEKLKATSPKSKRKGGKHYASGWRYKAGKFRSGHFESKVYNATHGSLTHLLENGHPIMSHGTQVGYSEAQPHIKPVEEWVDSELPRRIAEKMRKTK